MTSSRFREYFMNRGGFLDCDGGTRLPEVESAMSGRGVVPHFFIQESCGGIITKMIESGYEQVDRMAVMTPGATKLQAIRNLRVEVASGAGFKDWATGYLQSFYGSLDLLPSVTAVLQPMEALRDATLLVGRVRSTVAGVLALHRTPGLLGVYCVGTVPEFRGIGVAASMLQAALEAGEPEGRKVVLQTILSDGYEPYYQRRGFNRLYLKALLRKRIAISRGNGSG